MIEVSLAALTSLLFFEMVFCVSRTTVYTCIWLFEIECNKENAYNTELVINIKGGWGKKRGGGGVNKS